MARKIPNIFLIVLPFIATLINGDVHCNCHRPGLVALTFDDGPSVPGTLEVLDILQEYNVKATFFVSGLYNHESDLDRYMATIRTVFNEGHQLGNHGWSHLNMTSLTEQEMREEVEQLASKIREMLAINMTIFRPPLGLSNDMLESLLSLEFEYELIMWNVDTKDWANPGDTLQGLLAYREFLNETNGHLNTSIIGLHHDHVEGSRDLVRATLDFLIEMKMEIVTVSECVGISPYRNTSEIAGSSLILPTLTLTLTLPLMFISFVASLEF